MTKRDEKFCYNLIVSAARVMNKPQPTFKELLILLRASHQALNKNLPRKEVLKLAFKNFRKATSVSYFKEDIK